MSGKEICLSIASEDQVLLETKIKYGDKREICFVFTHPYGPLGGSFDHPVICNLFNYFAHQGYMTVKFNFRGVGNSTGKTSFTGSGEKQDLRSVINFVKKKSDLAPTHFVLVGYSYGCIPMGAVCAELPECIGMIAISYPAGVSWALTLWNSRKFANALGSISDNIPVLFIMGDQDNFTSVGVLENFVKSFSKNATVNIVSDMDHFWVNREENLLGHIKQWMYKNLDLKAFLKNEQVKNSKNSSQSLEKIDTSSKATLTSRSSFPMADKDNKCKTEKIGQKSHSLDIRNYSICQEAIEAIDNMRLEELLDSSQKTHSLNSLKKTTMNHFDSGSTILDSTHSLKQLERPKRPPPPVPASRIASDPTIKK